MERIGSDGASPRSGAGSVFFGSWMALGAWFALVLVGLRALVLFGMERMAHEVDLDLVRIRLASAFPNAAVVALATAGLGLAYVWWCEGLAPDRIVRRLLRAHLVVALTIVWFLVLVGWLDVDLSRRVGLYGRGKLAAVAILAATVVLALLAVALVARVRGAQLGSRDARRPWVGTVPPLAVLALAGGYLHIAEGRVSESMIVRSVEQELFAAQWEVLEGRPDQAPGPAILCPSLQYVDEGAGMPGLALPPPARARHVVETDGPRWLRARVGIDHSVRDDVGERYAGHAIRFRMRLDDEEVFSATLPIDDSQSWSGVGGTSGFLVADGTVVELETALLDPAGDEVTPDDPLLAGFGGLDLEQRFERERTRSSPTAPNVVLILIDTLRADRTSAYGYERDTTPHLAELAERGTLFSEAHSTASWTWPSTASLFTGMYPQEHGVLDAQSSFLQETLDTLAEALQREGFTTAAWSASPLIVPDKNFDQGFETFDGPKDGSLRSSGVVMPPALEWLSAVGDNRFFLYLHILDPHLPPEPLPEGRRRFAAEVPSDFDPRSIGPLSWELRHVDGLSDSGEPEPERLVSPEKRRWINDLYDACVWSADHWVGELLARLDALDLGDRTIVVVTSDHGEELFDHGLLSHAHTLYRELTRVPLVFAGPGIPRGQRIDRPLSSADVAPTLARLAGARLRDLDGAADLFAAGPADGMVLFSTEQGWWNGTSDLSIYGLREGSQVLHYAPEGRAFGAEASEAGGQCRLFDLASDPEERVDLAGREPERVHELREELLRRIEELEARRATPAVSGGDPATMEMLRGLGYVGDEHEKEHEKE